MLDGEKFLRELPVLHGKIEMPDYNGVCTGVYLTRINRKSFAFPLRFNYNKEKRWRNDSCYLRINTLTKSPA